MNETKSVPSHIEFLQNHPEIATLHYRAHSEITGESEVCIDHPEISYVKSGQRIQGIPEVDRVGIFATCQCRTSSFRCTCEKCSLQVTEDGITGDTGSEDTGQSGNLRNLKKLKRLANRLKFPGKMTRKEKKAQKKKQIEKMGDNYISLVDKKTFCNKRGLPVRPEDECITEFLMNKILKMMPVK